MSMQETIKIVDTAPNQDGRPPDIRWARENIRGFAAYHDEVIATKEDQARYQDHGYKANPTGRAIQVQKKQH